MSIDKINKLLEKAPEGRPSYYQLKHFVLGKQSTVQAQLWQCLRELQDRKETMDNITFEIENCKDKLSLIEIDVQELELDQEDEPLKPKDVRDILKSARRIIKIKGLKRQEESVVNNINSLHKRYNFAEQEARFFLQAFEALSKVEPLKDFDDFEAQKEFWETKISEEINLRILCKQNMCPDLLKTALSLHEGSKVKEEMLKLISVFDKARISEKDDKQIIECRSEL